MPTEIARRVARRHQAAVSLRNVPAKDTRIEYSNSGTISAVALMKMLEPSIGKLVKLRFRPAIIGTPNTIAWESLDENANVVTGMLVLHAAVSDEEIVSWAEVVVDADRDARVARRVAVRYMRRTEGLVRVEEEEDEWSRTTARNSGWR